MNYYYSPYTGELYHHGIKGQRWGVRRFQNADGSLTAAGRKRYNVDIAGAKEKYNQAYRTANTAKVAYNRIHSRAAAEKAKQANKDLRWAKRDLDSEKVKEKLNRESKKSKRRQKLEEEYRAKGMSEEEAAVAAYKRAKTEKIIAGIAGATLAATAAYVAYRHYDRNVDKIIPGDTLLSRITSNGDSSVHDAFYASFKDSDNKRYLGMYGNALRNQGNTVFQKTIGLNGDLRVASEKTARNALSEMFNKNPKMLKDFKDSVSMELKIMDDFNSTEKQRRVLKKAADSLARGVVDSNVYNAFNYGLADHTESVDTFYKTLLSKGYDAVTDLNDKRFSGYGSKSSMIVFNSAKTVVDKVREVPVKELMNAGATENAKWTSQQTAKQLASQFGKQAGSTLAIAGGTVAIGKIGQAKRNDRIVAEYRQKHPDTKLSYNEILKNYG
jgi:hypothetical protein